MYKYRKSRKSKLTGVEVYEGESIEEKVERVMTNNEPIKDGAPEIFTERKDGVLSAYNIRTDRWEIATEAMDMVQKSIQAKRDEKAKTSNSKKETKVVDLKGKDISGTESIVTEAK